MENFLLWYKEHELNMNAKNGSPWSFWITRQLVICVHGLLRAGLNPTPHQPAPVNKAWTSSRSRTPNERHMWDDSQANVIYTGTWVELEYGWLNRCFIWDLEIGGIRNYIIVGVAGAMEPKVIESSKCLEARECYESRIAMWTEIAHTTESEVKWRKQRRIFAHQRVCHLENVDPSPGITQAMASSGHGRHACVISMGNRISRMRGPLLIQ